MNKKKFTNYLGFIFLLLVFYYLFFHAYPSQKIHISYPLPNTKFPPEFPPPTFTWKSKDNYSKGWSIKLYNKSGTFVFDTIVYTNQWQPHQQVWRMLKQFSKNETILFSISKAKGLGTKKISFQFSIDSVGAPILFRQLPIPFVLAEQILDSMNYILIDVGHDGPPHVAMKSFPVCGNCHSFTNDGKKIGLDLDAGLRDKGGYFVANISDSMVFDEKNYHSWTKKLQSRTFGLFSKLSPDGRYILTTINDRVVIKNFPYDPEHMAFSQLFFPVNGKLAIYDRYKKELFELPGANFDEYVQSNATWTPDGKHIVFCRSKALKDNYNPGELNVNNEILIQEFVDRKRTFKYDIYIIPFNEGKGGEARPIKGASNNGKSNYFPAISPDGKWIVFCMADNFMLLQPDSRLYIVPIEGGKARKLECNLPLMNSWHTWSPNGKWLAFVSKGFSIFTDLFITHIDENGKASPPVLIEKARKYRRVVNYPEFINILPSQKFNMIYDYVELIHIQKALDEKNFAKAHQLYYKWKQQEHFFILEEDILQVEKFIKKLKLNTEYKWIKELKERYNIY